MTLSGGEPLSQGAFATELLLLAREKGIHTCVETSGYCAQDVMRRAAEFTDLFLFDIIVVLINIVGFLCCCVGLYVTSIISEFMYVELYYRLSNDGNPASPAEDVVFDGRDADGYNRSI